MFFCFVSRRGIGSPVVSRRAPTPRRRTALRAMRRSIFYDARVRLRDAHIRLRPRGIHLRKRRTHRREECTRLRHPRTDDVQARTRLRVRDAPRVPWVYPSTRGEYASRMRDVSLAEQGHTPCPPWCPPSQLRVHRCAEGAGAWRSLAADWTRGQDPLRSRGTRLALRAMRLRRSGQRLGGRGTRLSLIGIRLRWKGHAPFTEGVRASRSLESAWSLRATRLRASGFSLCARGTRLALVVSPRRNVAARLSKTGRRSCSRRSTTTTVGAHLRAHRSGREKRPPGPQEPPVAPREVTFFSGKVSSLGAPGVPLASWRFSPRATSLGLGPGPAESSNRHRAGSGGSTGSPRRDLPSMWARARKRWFARSGAC